LQIDQGGYHYDWPTISQDNRYVALLGSFGPSLLDRSIGKTVPMDTTWLERVWFVPTISGNGRYLAYAVGDAADPRYTRIIDRSTGNVKNIFGLYAFGFRFTHDGRYLLWNTDYGPWYLYDRDSPGGGGATDLHAAYGIGPSANVTISDDGSKIAFTGDQSQFMRGTYLLTR